MKNLPSNLYYKIQQLSEEVRFDLRRKGVVAPTRNPDGSITVGNYKIIKQKLGYSILDAWGDAIVSGINLPQSAILIANGLALGKYKDDAIINMDRYYGYALFDEEVHNRAVANSKKKTLEYYDLMSTKAAIAKSRKENYKRDLLNRFEKLIQLV